MIAGRLELPSKDGPCNKWLPGSTPGKSGYRTSSFPHMAVQFDFPGLLSPGTRVELTCQKKPGQEHLAGRRGLAVGKYGKHFASKGSPTPRTLAPRSHFGKQDFFVGERILPPTERWGGAKCGVYSSLVTEAERSSFGGPCRSPRKKACDSLRINASRRSTVADLGGRKCSTPRLAVNLAKLRRRNSTNPFHLVLISRVILHLAVVCPWLDRALEFFAMLENNLRRASTLGHKPTYRAWYSHNGLLPSKNHRPVVFSASDQTALAAPEGQRMIGGVNS
jgi:hypothetical protein